MKLDRPADETVIEDDTTYIRLFCITLWTVTSTYLQRHHMRLFALLVDRQIPVFPKSSDKRGFPRLEVNLSSELDLELCCNL